MICQFIRKTVSAVLSVSLAVLVLCPVARIAAAALRVSRGIATWITRLARVTASSWVPALTLAWVAALSGIALAWVLTGVPAAGVPALGLPRVPGTAAGVSLAWISAARVAALRALTWVSGAYGAALVPCATGTRGSVLRGSGRGLTATGYVRVQAAGWCGWGIRVVAVVGVVSVAG